MAALLLPAALAAHPHARVDQQAHLSVGRTQAVVTYYLTPSVKSGGHMFDHVDTNGDGMLSRAEKSAFASALLVRSRLEVDGRSTALAITHHAFPDRAALAAGRGTIRVRAHAKVSLASGSKHRLAFEVTHDRFAKGWSVQPFYFSDLAVGRSRPTVSRTRGSNAVAIAL